ncbi:hypothetical protein JCM8097_008183 [Rhodosporidiobolus ruineniae]
MAAPPSPAAFDDAWSQYVQAPSQPAYHVQDASVHSQPAYASTSTAPYPDAAGAMGPPPPSSAPRDAYYSQTSGGGGLRIDGYADPAYTFAPQRSHSHGTTPSPALPALSPASSISTSSGFVSPYQVFSAGESPEQYRVGGPGLLPPASIHDGGVGGGAGGSQQQQYFAAGKGNSGWFAEMQETYLQQHEQPPSLSASYGPSSYALTPAPSVPPPSTPRRHAPSSTHLWRSPSGYSITSSPTTSPYHRPTTPRLAAGMYPSDFPTPTGSAGRRGSTGGLLGEPYSPSSSLSRPRSAPRRGQVATPVTVVDVNGSPTKSVRRQARLSIEVPPAGHGLSRSTSSTSSRSATSSLPPPPQPVFLAPPQQQQPMQQVEADAGLSEASVREVEQLLGELGTILETGGAYEHQDMLMPPQPFPQQHQQQQQSRHRVQAGSYGMQQQQSLPPLQQQDVFAPTSISISGVTLAEEDLALLDTPSIGGDGSGQFQPLPPSPERAPPAHRSYPSSAPAWRTSFDMPPPPRPSHRASYEMVEGAPQSYQPPPSPVYPSAGLAIPQPSQQYAHHSPQPHPSFRPSSAPRDAAPIMMSPVAAGRRRRSSVDSAAIASSTSHLHYSPYPPPASPSRSYHRHPPQHAPQYEQHPHQQQYISQHPQYLQQSPSRPPSTARAPSQQNYRPLAASSSSAAPAPPPRRRPSLDFPTVLRPAPPPGAAPRDVTPPPSPTKAGAPSTPGTPGQKATPKRKRVPAKPKPAVSMFINFSAKDSKKLLSGVAPSGSTKKKREEEEAAAAASAERGAGANGSEGGAEASSSSGDGAEAGPAAAGSS